MTSDKRPPFGSPLSAVVVPLFERERAIAVSLPPWLKAPRTEPPPPRRPTLEAVRPPPPEPPAEPHPIAEEPSQAARPALIAAAATLPLTSAEGYLDAIEELGQLHRSARRTIAMEAVSLGLVVAKEIIGHDLRLDPEHTAKLVDEAIAALGEAGPLEVRVAPEVLEPLRRARPDLASRGVTIVADPSLAPGGCVVDGLHRTIDASLETRLEAVRQALAAALAGTATADLFSENGGLRDPASEDASPGEGRGR